MGHLCPVASASLQYLFGPYIFKKFDATDYSPLLSSLIVLLSIGLLLISLPLYPVSLRKLWPTANLIAEYLIAVFIIENLMGNFWFPLELAVISIFPTFAACLEEFLLNYNWTCDRICDFLRMEAVGIMCSYLLSILILVAVLHAARFIDLRLLESGSYIFFQDIVKRVKRKSLKISKKFGLLNKKKTNRNRKSEFYGSDDDCTNFDTEPVDDSNFQNFHFVYK